MMPFVGLQVGAQAACIMALPDVKVLAREEETAPQTWHMCQCERIPLLKLCAELYRMNHTHSGPAIRQQRAE